PGGQAAKARAPRPPRHAAGGGRTQAPGGAGRGVTTQASGAAEAPPERPHPRGLPPPPPPTKGGPTTVSPPPPPPPPPPPARAPPAPARLARPARLPRVQPPAVRGYVGAPHSLGQAIALSTNVVLTRVPAVDRTNNRIIFAKARDLKGTHKPEEIRHNIG